MKLTHFSRTVTGLVRPANEDFIDSIVGNNNEYTNVFIVCDGMGGHVGGARASKIAVNSIKEYFTNSPDQVPGVALKESIEFANMQIFGDAQLNTEFKGMGTTVTLLVENNGLIYIAHVGDSRIYVYTDKNLFRLTKDHSFVQSLVDEGVISDAEMETHPRKNELTRALGIGVEVEVDVCTQPIRAKQGDKFLLCSDGLCGMINDKTIQSSMSFSNSLEGIVNQFIELSNNAGGIDNISADLIEILESDSTKTVFIDKSNEALDNTGTQEVLINTSKSKRPFPKPHIKKLIIYSILFAVLSSASFFIFIKNEKTEPPITDSNEKVQVKIQENILLEELLAMKKSRKKSGINDNQCHFIYCIVAESSKQWSFPSFIEEIEKNDYRKIEKGDTNQRFVINDSIYSYIDTKDKYHGTEISFPDSFIIFIEVEYLKKDESDIDHLSSNSSFSSTQDDALEKQIDDLSRDANVFFNRIINIRKDAKLEKNNRDIDAIKLCLNEANSNIQKIKITLQKAENLKKQIIQKDVSLNKIQNHLNNAKKEKNKILTRKNDVELNIKNVADKISSIRSQVNDIIERFSEVERQKIQADSVRDDFFRIWNLLKDKQQKDPKFSSLDKKNKVHFSSIEDNYKNLNIINDFAIEYKNYSEEKLEQKDVSEELDNKTKKFMDLQEKFKEKFKLLISNSKKLSSIQDNPKNNTPIQITDNDNIK
tara:strand:- start:10937 stop:13060 length:2124 start_codon:yes stop_codon:yes gene_type:complete